MSSTAESHEWARRAVRQLLLRVARAIEMECALGLVAAQRLRRGK